MRNGRMWDRSVLIRQAIYSVMSDRLLMLTMEPASMSRPPFVIIWTSDLLVWLPGDLLRKSMYRLGLRHSIPTPSCGRCDGSQGCDWESSPPPGSDHRSEEQSFDAWRFDTVYPMGEVTICEKVLGMVSPVFGPLHAMHLVLIRSLSVTLLWMSGASIRYSRQEQG